MGYNNITVSGGTGERKNRIFYSKRVGGTESPHRKNKLRGKIQKAYSKRVGGTRDQGRVRMVFLAPVPSLDAHLIVPLIDDCAKRDSEQKATH